MGRVIARSGRDLAKDAIQLNSKSELKRELCS